MKANDMLEEIHRVRRDHARRFGGNLKAIFEDMRLKQQHLDNVVDLGSQAQRRMAVAENPTPYSEKK